MAGLSVLCTGMDPPAPQTTTGAIGRTMPRSAMPPNPNPPCSSATRVDCWTISVAERLPILPVYSANGLSETWKLRPPPPFQAGRTFGLAVTPSPVPVASKRACWALYLSAS